MAARKPCIDCGRPTDGGARCAVHQAERDRADDRRRHAKQAAHGRNRSAWRRDMREAALARDGGECRLRHDGCTLVATSVHLDPRLQGRHQDATLDDLVSACAHCHGVEDGARATKRGHLQDKDPRGVARSSEGLSRPPLGSKMTNPPGLVLG